MAVAVPRTAPAPTRRRPRTAPRPVETDPKRARRAAAKPKTAAPRRTRTTRASASGRLRPFRIAAVVAIIGVALSAIVYLHVSSLRATMQAGELRAQVEATRSDATNIQAETEQRLADGRVERAAAAYGMVLVPSEAMRTLPVRVPKAEQAR